MGLALRHPDTVFKADRPVTKLDGDYDVFGDGSVRLISTPGHTPGHESLLVDLPKTGYVPPSGDAVDFRRNWENRRVLAGNTDTAQSLASMQRLADIWRSMTRSCGSITIRRRAAR